MNQQNFMKQIINLKSTIEFQDNSIVSKTIINKGNTSITLFAFDAGQNIAAHTAPVDALVQVIEGEVEVIISGEKFNLNEGEIIIMPEGEPHSLTAKTKFKMALFKL